MIALTSFSAIVGLCSWTATRIPLPSSASKKSPEPGCAVIVLGVESIGGDMVHNFFFLLWENKIGLFRLASLAASEVSRPRFSWGFLSWVGQRLLVKAFMAARTAVDKNIR